jgi:hypothetical protein
VLLISVPLALLWAGPAASANPGAAQALQILTRARIADERCHFLSTMLHDELARYAARAEVAAAQQLSPSVASTAIAAGNAEGKSASCDDRTRSDVSDTLNAARQAVRRADAMGPAVAPQATSAPSSSAPQTTDALPGGRSGSLTQYAQALGPYYLERKCKMLSPNQDDRYWRAITSLHRATVAQNGYGAVRLIMHRAEVSAATRDCGDAALLTIKTGFAAAMNN